MVQRTLLYRTLGAFGYLGESLVLVLAGLIFAALYVNPQTTAAPPWAANSLSEVGFEALAALSVGLVSFAWFYSGRESRTALFVATGVMGFILVAASIVSSVTAFSLSSAPASQNSTPSQALQSVLDLILVAFVVGVLGLVFVVLEVISLFRAASVFKVRHFYYAAWGRVITFLGAIVSFFFGSIILTFYFLSQLAANGSPPPGSSQTTPSFVSDFGVLIAVIYSVLAVPGLFAALGFRRIKDEGQGPHELPNMAPPSPLEGSAEPALVDGT